MARGTTARARDRFDDVPEDLARVGAHRAPSRRRGVTIFAWAALATGVLVGAGVLGLSAIERGAIGTVGTSTGTSSSAAAARPAATVDPAATVVILNATTTSGLAKNAATTAEAADWKVASTANADTTDVKLSTVYYSAASQLGAALGLAKSLEIGRTPVQTKRFDVQGESRLTVVLGADYTPSS
ncbi:LytR C-terminal domain-containing protein [uncultured Amnibacterium sp.]|uniref:LytR C-terminal domain-containing protein n=1 Tax=uncultured Amnibacterium sp. TaxID=1631851 RepID=UPI0035CB0453